MPTPSPTRRSGRRSCATPTSTIDQKHTLLTVYESFVAHAVDAAAVDAMDEDDQDRVTVVGDALPTAGSKAHESRPTA